MAISAIPTLEEFLQELGLKPGAFGAQLFEPVYESMFVEAIDLRRDYERYYRVEYQSLASFLDLVHDLRLEPHEMEKSHLMLVEEAHGVADEMYEDNQLKLILDCIRRLEEKHEN